MSKNKKELENFLKPKNILPPHRLLRNARAFMGVSRELLARRMGISYETLEAYERGRRRIPNTILIKLYMFGIDFWIDDAVLKD